MSERSWAELSDDELMAHLMSVCREDAWIKAEIITYLIEVEARSLYLRKACTSMFDFCTRLLRMSRNVASARIAVARLASRHRCLLPAIARGELHLSTAVLLKDHLTTANAEKLLGEIRGMSYREVEELLAARAPKPDVPDMIAPVAEQTTLSASGAPRRSVARVTPLSPTRFAVQLTVSAELRAKLERAKDLMRHRNPGGNLEVILDRALDSLIANLEKKLRGKTKRPGPAREASDGAVSASARREVFDRDGERCTYQDEDGNRCPARGFLEIDHVEARARGGRGIPPNLRVRCKPHNRLHAEAVFGRDHVARAIERRRSSPPSPAPAPAPAPAVAPAPAPDVATDSASLEPTAPGVAAKAAGVAASPATKGEMVEASPIDRAEHADDDAPSEEVFDRDQLSGGGQGLEREVDRGGPASPSHSARTATPAVVPVALVTAETATAADPPAKGGSLHTERSEHAGGPARRGDERARALRGLVGLGFERFEATHALDTVLRGRRELLGLDALPGVLREAIGMLT